MQSENDRLNTRDKFNYHTGWQATIGGAVVIFLALVSTPAMPEVFWYLGSGLILIGLVLSGVSWYLLKKRNNGNS